MKDLGRNWVDRLAANSKVPTYTFDEKVKSVLKSLICEELGPVYYEICEEAVSIVSDDLKQYITHLPEGKVKKRLSQFVESHVPKLISQIDAVNLSNECNDCFLEKF